MKSINICGLDYKIIYSDTLLSEKGLVGQIDYVKQEIMIDNIISKDRQRITLYHEVIHGILEEAGYFSINKNEKLINVLSFGIYQALEDGKESVCRRHE